MQLNVPIDELKGDSTRDKVVTITVTYNPVIEQLHAQLQGLPEECEKLIVDNASEPEVLTRIAALAMEFKNTVLIRLDGNLGVAGAVNRGAEEIAKRDRLQSYLLLLDQDSEPHKDSVANLLQGFETLRQNGERVGCVGPTLYDTDTGLTHGFHQHTRWRWRRVYAVPGQDEHVRCASINGSGTMLPLQLFRNLGGLDESLFIDHVDTEWSFRVQAAGYSLWGIPGAVFDHRMGTESTRFWFFGWHIWPTRSPSRHYYLFRNAALLSRRSYVPRVWKFWAGVKLLLTGVVTLLVGPQRTAQVRNMYRGIRDGFTVPQGTK